MSQDNVFPMQCTVCKNKNYWTSKNKKLVTRKLEMSKFCKFCRKHTKHKESKK